MPITPSTPKNKALSTPIQQKAAPSPGKWRHPQYNEIVRRQTQCTFGERNVRIILLNTFAMFVVHLVATSIRKRLDSSSSSLTLPPIPIPIGILLMIVRLYFLFNITVALYPLFRPKDNLTDIPLTPSQRRVLGIAPAPSNAAVSTTTPASVYSTPPKYKPVAASMRNLNGRSSPSSPGAGASTGASAAKGSPLSPGFRSPSASFFAAGASSASFGGSGYNRTLLSTSPLFQRSSTTIPLNGTLNNSTDFGASGNATSFGNSVDGGYATPTRSMFGSSILTNGLDESVNGGLSSPSPAGVGSPNRVVSPFMVNKWLYEKTRPGAL